MIAAGNRIRSVWGDLFEVTRIDPTGQVWCRGEDTPPLAWVLIPAAAIGRTHHVEARPLPADTLGAARPGGSWSSVPHVETWYWRPCMTPSLKGGPHCWFIASNLVLSLWCPTCRPERIRVADRAPAPPTAASPPWWPGQPVWTGAGNADDIREWYEERAAIMEYDGGLPRHVAEREAYRLVQIRIDNARAARGAQLALVA